MKIIKSVCGQDILVDDEHYEYLNQFRWNVGGYGYALSGMNKGSGSAVCMHIVVAQLVNLDTSQEVDHKDRNKLNNQSNNLRAATHSQNAANTKKNPGFHSQYRGVTWYRRNSCWQVRLKANYKIVFCKYFKDEVEAAKAYDKAAFEHYGEFAVLNFPEDYNQATN